MVIELNMILVTGSPMYRMYCVLYCRVDYLIVNGQAHTLCC